MFGINCLLFFLAYKLNFTLINILIDGLLDIIKLQYSEMFGNVRSSSLLLCQEE